jgi:hypothetical protein
VVLLLTIGIVKKWGGGRHLCDAPEGGNKMIIGTKTDLVFLYQHSTVFSGKLAMATGHAQY